ncbi:SMC-Scp complex subunit ScpB [Candidatus Sumerlaeota bacterium]|nr:SMC-Scp complex subunit ScpB [Candidatus Sumerlaeota bacterium]
MREEELKPIIESLLFSTAEPLSANRISKMLDDIPTKNVRSIIAELSGEYGEPCHGIQIVEIAGGYQVATKPEFSSYILKLERRKKKSPLSTPALETLAIIAYKQPITRAEIESIRGVDSSGVIRNLTEMDLIKIVGKKEVVGRPPLYGTSEEFLRAFGLNRLSDLPSLKELREKFSQVQEETPPEKQAQSQTQPQSPPPENIDSENAIPGNMDSGIEDSENKE